MAGRRFDGLDKGSAGNLVRRRVTLIIVWRVCALMCCAVSLCVRGRS